MLFLLVSCSQDSFTAVPTTPVTATQNIDVATFTPEPSPTLPNPTLTAFIVPRERPPFFEALFTVLSDDQTRLLAAYEGEMNLQTLYQFSASSSRAQVVFHPAGFPVISRDGVWVTVVEDEDLRTHIMSIPLVGPNESTAILNWPGCQSAATISPDGKRVAFLSIESKCDRHSTVPPMHVYVMDSDGQNVKRITTEAVDRCFLTWSPNSMQIAYQEICDPAASSPWQVYVVTLEPFNTPRQMTQITASGALVGGASSAWSPDGEWLQWVTMYNGSFGNHRLSRLDAEGKLIAEIVSALPGKGLWAADSKRLAHMTRMDQLTALIIWNIESGEITTFELPDVQPSTPQQLLPDGERLVFAGYRLDSQGELVPGSKWFMMNIDGTNLIEFEEP